METVSKVIGSVGTIQSQGRMEPPSLPTDCCKSGCANCVWLEYAEATLTYYTNIGKALQPGELFRVVEANIQDPMIKTFVKMELKSKYKYL